ncbi:ORF4 polyprotein [Frankliniella fusca]|uniref:ORF4 polyprotein n=1 Tax=Frankliniella fusca TaxID=407009 RepID=A0AAE1H5A1_9NEOP|nr:ORF4 polyprotein [Frankliniella fusca]
MGDDMESVVSRHVDPTLQRMASDGSPLVSSGVSAAGSLGSAQSIDPSPQLDLGQGFKCCVCKKVLKTKKGFLNHTFLHNVADASQKKPNIDFVEPKVAGIVLMIVREMSVELNVPEEKEGILKHVQSLEESNTELVEFGKEISKPILDGILKKSKLLPTNQYEEVLSSVNKYLCEERNMLQLQLSFSRCLPSLYRESKYLRNIVFRISFRLTEELELLVLREINSQYKSNAAVSIPAQNTFGSETEKRAFKDHILKLMRTYFVKANRINTPVYRSRCECIKRRIFETGDEDFITTEIVLDSQSWLQEKIYLSDRAVEFFLHIQGVIKISLQDESNDLRQHVLDKIVQEVAPLNLWHTLTVNYFSESDSLVFMREVVMMVVDMSVLLAEKKLKVVANEQKKLQKFSVRENLKRN